MPLTETGTEVYVATMTNILPDYYYYLVDTLNHMKSLKLKDNQGGDAADCYDTILENVEGLESTGAFNPKHLAISFAYLRIIMILYFISGRLRSTRRLWSLLRNLYCVMKTSYKMMISLTMASLFNNLCENTAALLT